MTKNTASTSTGKTEPKAASKISLVTDLLERAQGAALEEMVKATGWLPHNSRGTHRPQEKGPHNREEQA